MVMRVLHICDCRKVVDGPQVLHLVCPLPQSSPSELRQRHTATAGPQSWVHCLNLFCVFSRKQWPQPVVSFSKFLAPLIQGWDRHFLVHFKAQDVRYLPLPANFFEGLSNSYFFPILKVVFVRQNESMILSFTYVGVILRPHSTGTAFMLFCFWPGKYLWVHAF